MAKKWRDVHGDLYPEDAKRFRDALKFLRKVGGEASWGRLPRGDPHGVTVPVPESSSFDYPAPDALVLARTCELLTHRPVVLTGGGWGPGDPRLMILLGVSVEYHFPAKEGKWEGPFVSSATPGRLTPSPAA